MKNKGKAVTAEGAEERRGKKNRRVGESENRRELSPFLPFSLSSLLSFFFLCVLCVSAVRLGFAQDMVLIPAGKFNMGSKHGDADELPVHEVYLDAFYMDKYEVTNAQYRKFMQAAGHREPYGWNNPRFNQESLPVVGVDWEDADAYCKWAGKRLPTEAEWEKAASGPKGYPFPWGEKWNEANCNSAVSKKKGTTAAGSYPQGVSGYGCYDMAGNVWEWCSDWYGELYYKSSPPKNPAGSLIGDTKVLRGGSWMDPPIELRTTNRYRSHPIVRFDGVGFRCARDAKKL